MELPDALPDATVPEVPFPLPALHLTDAIPPAQPASDASDAVPPDEAADAVLPALAAAMYVEKLAVPALDVPAPDAKSHPALPLPEEAPALYTPAAVPSAA